MKENKIRGSGISAYVSAANRLKLSALFMALCFYSINNKELLYALNLAKVDVWMWGFIFGKDEIVIDNLSLMIKYYIY